MKVYLNGHSKILNEDTTVLEVIQQFGIESKRMVVELNGRVVKRSSWPTQKLSEKD